MTNPRVVQIMQPPSTALLRAFLQPQCCTCQRRFATNWMPREKYAKATSLDKLHRQQKAAIRKEREESHLRAKAMTPPVLTLPTPANQLSSSSLNPEVSTLSSDSTATSPSLPYFITRTKSRNLPIYETSKAGGSKHITQIRKLSGDLTLLQKHIQEALNLSESFLDQQGRKKENISINPVTQQIIVRGWRGPEIRRWAEMVGF